MEKKSGFHKFLLADFTREEEWLNEQAAEGWHLVDTDGATYEFQKGNKGAWIYRTDDIRKEDDPNTYLDKYTPAGWKYVCRTKDRAYLRQRKVGKPIDTSMFTPEEERLAFVRRLLRTQVLKALPFYLAGVLFVIGALCSRNMTTLPTVVPTILHVLAFIVIVLVTTAIGVNMNEFRRYNRIMKLKNAPEQREEMSLKDALQNMEE